MIIMITIWIMLRTVGTVYGYRIYSIVLLYTVPPGKVHEFPSPAEFGADDDSVIS